MSHDLEFRPRGDQPDEAAITQYFADHPWITPDPTDPQVERYFHPTTEITLRYERFEPSEDEPRLPVALAVDYLGPHVIADEMAEEVARFTGRFDLEVIDLCDDGSTVELPTHRPRRLRQSRSERVPTGAFDADRLVRSYDRGNFAAYQVHFHPERDRGCAQPRPTLPSDDLAAIWRWNYEVADHDDSPVVVPAITCLELFGIVRSATRWIAPEDLPTGSGIRLPAVDLLIVVEPGLHDRPPVLVPFGDVEWPRTPAPDPRSETSPRLPSIELTAADVGRCTLPDLAPLASSPWVTVPFRRILDREWVDALPGAS